jgi:hypothetical protein
VKGRRAPPNDLAVKYIELIVVLKCGGKISLSKEVILGSHVETKIPVKNLPATKSGK